MYAERVSRAVVEYFAEAIEDLTLDIVRDRLLT